MKKILALLMLLPLSAMAEVTKGGYSVLDTDSYQRPAFVALTVPTEATAPHYYVNYSTGTGSTCSQVAPCATLAAVSGKTGVSGGPAYIYVKGNGYLDLTATTLFGAPGSEIVIKPWPGDSTPTVWTANGGCNRGNANTIDNANVHDLIVDGGPSNLISWTGSGCTGNQNGYTTVVTSNNITFYRTRINANNSGGPALGVAAGTGGNLTSNFRFINSELYNAGNYYGVYIGGGAVCGTDLNYYDHAQFINSIFRQIDGRGIQAEPRGNGYGLTVTGNVFHHIGFDASGNNGGPSTAVEPAGSCGKGTGTGGFNNAPNDGSTDFILIANNFGYDYGGGMDRVDFTAVTGSATHQQIDYNTVYDYSKATVCASSGTAVANCHGIASFGNTLVAEVKGNIFIKNSGASGTICALSCDKGGAFVTSKNLCDTSGGNCGSTSITGTAAATFYTTTLGLNYLWITTTSGATAAGTNLFSEGITIDFLGLARPSTGTNNFGIGAMQFPINASLPPPSSLGVH